MKLEIDMPEHHYNSIMAFDSVRLWRVPYKGVIMYAINAIKRGKALDQEPTTKNDLGVDAVNREAVLDLIADYDLSMGQVVKGIHALPSVTPQEPKTGKWISTETKGVRYAFWCRYKCSLCGGLSDRTNFCPNCGARMVEPQESKENENIN